MKKARLSFSPIEKEYNRRYGKFPDYDTTDMIDSGVPPDQAGKTVNDRMDAIWKDMQKAHKEETEDGFKPYWDMDEEEQYETDRLLSAWKGKEENG